MTRRALTLLETLAAAVLLTLLAGACVPVLRSAAATRAPGGQVHTADDLAALVRGLEADPALAGLERWPPVQPGRVEVGFPWPGDPAGAFVRVQLLGPAGLAGPGDAHDHTWLFVSCGSAHVSRYLALPAREPTVEETRR